MHDLPALLARPRGPIPQQITVPRRDVQGRVVNGLLAAVGATNEVLLMCKPELLHAKANATSSSSKRQAAATTAALDKKPVAKKKHRKTTEKTAAASAASQATVSNATAATVSISSSSTTNPNEAVQLYCVCKSPWDETSELMIGCDGPCQNWYHLECIGGLVKGSENVFLDVASGAAVDETKEFFCPACESSSTKPLPETSRLWGARLLNLADAVDSLVANVSEASLSQVDKGLRVRWKLLMDARTEPVTCTACQVPHHPLLPCIGTQVATPIVEAAPPASAMQVEGAQCLVIHGKYLGLCGVAQQQLDKDVTVLHVGEFGSNLKLPKSSLLELPGGGSEVPNLGEVDWFGVTKEGDVYLAHLLVGSAQVPLGSFASSLMAARCHDIAALLQSGTEAAVLNFDAMMMNGITSKASDSASTPEAIVEWALLGLKELSGEEDERAVRNRARLEWVLAALGESVAAAASRLETSLLSTMDTSDATDLDDFMDGKLAALNKKL